MTGREALRLATRGGAAVLGRDDVGALAPGMAADIVGVRMDSLAFAGGAVHDALAALVFCRPGNVDFTIVNGVPLVEHGTLRGIDLERIVSRHNVLARELVSGR
jgi:cytosine/adenosine deaminase-related metal-dependent hydrolase